MKKIIFSLIFTALSVVCYGQCTGVPASGTSKAYAYKSCKDTVLGVSVLNTVHADTTDVNRLTINGLSSGVLKSTSGVISNATAETDYTSPAGSGTLSNKTISGSSNTLTNIGNSSLTNSSISIAGNSTALGGSVTQDQITGLSSTGLVKRTGTSTLGIATPNADYATTAYIDSALAVKNAMNTVVIGNSIAAQSKWQSALGGYWNTSSDVHYCNAFAGSPMIFRSITASTRADQYCVYGYSGATLATILTDLQAQLYTPLQTANIKVDCVWGHSLLENSIAQSATVSDMQLQITQFIRDIRARFPGAIIILSTPRPSTGYDNPTKVSNYNSIESYIQSLDNSKDIFVTTLNAYEDGSTGLPLSGYSDGTHPNAKGAVLLARTEAATFARIAKIWKQPYFAISSNMALSGTGAASGTNVTGTFATNVAGVGASTATFVCAAETPGFTEQITISAGTTVGAFVDIGTTNFSAISISPSNSYQFCPFIKIEIVSGAQNLNGIKLWPRMADGSGSPFTPYITPQTGDAQPVWNNGDILTFIMPPQTYVTAPLTSHTNYVRFIPSLVQDGTGFKVRIISQGTGIFQNGAPVLTSQAAGLTSGRIPIATTNGLLTDLSNLTYSTNRLSPTYITLAAGTSTANTAPLKFTSGTLNTTAETGAAEYNNSFYQTKNSGLRYGLGGQIFESYADAGNSTTTETDLHTYTTPASTLEANGAKITVDYAGTFVSSGTATRQMKVYFGGTAIFDSGALTISASASWDVKVTIIRVSSTVVRYTVTMNTQNAALASYTSVGELTGLTLSNTNIIKITGQAAGVGAATNDIVLKLSTGEWKPVSAN